MGSPAAILEEIAGVLAHFETTAVASATELAEDHALVEVTPIGAEPRHAHLCEMTRGFLSEIPRIFGMDPAILTEHECSARGGRRCVYAMSWDGAGGWEPEAAVVVEAATAEADVVVEAAAAEPDGAVQASEVDGVEVVIEADVDLEVSFEASDRVDEATAVDEEDAAEPETEPDAEAQRETEVDVDVDVADEPAVAVAEATPAEQGRSGRETDQLRTLVEGSVAAAPEVIEDDVDGLLARVAHMADEIVTAPSYLLMIRVGPGAPIQLHHRGLEPNQAQVLAAELWREHPDDAGGSRRIVDIASSRRRYGRLAEFLPQGVRTTPDEDRVLALYAQAAAAALDTHAVLAETRRNAATAQALLSFSESLSQVTNLADAVQLLADVVPNLTGCDQSTVYLWDRASSQLVPRARTSGLSFPGSYLGPIQLVEGTDEEPERPAVAPGRRAGQPAPVSNGQTPSDPTRGDDGDADSERENADVPNVRADIPQIEHMFTQRRVMVVDATADDPTLRRLMAESRTEASVVAPLFASGEFLGAIAANFRSGSPATTVHDPDLHERLSGLADQAATALQNLELLEEVSHMAWHDALTGLPNRRLFEDRVDQELVRSRRVGEPVCMFFVDLDHFKDVNDSLGHAGGDDLILQVGQRLGDTVRGQDTVARVGGDEFAILLPGLADQPDIDQLAQRTLEALSTPFIVFGQQLTTSGSIGIAIAPDHGDTYDELLGHADEAMYRAKDAGRNAYQLFVPPDHGQDAGRPSLDDRVLYPDLVHALDNHEFFVLYQPYIDLETAAVVGVEALVRWNHPTLGVLEPSAFISLAERSDVIVALDNWVLEQACVQIRAWIDEGLSPLRLSVNLASRDLSDPDFSEHIDRTLAESGIDPSLLELEITQRVVLDTAGPAQENIERLRRLGVRFTIDDFGLGNSSLNRIGSFPISTLKIDQSFVQVLGPDGENNSLVSAIISMANRLGLACVAEGVETSQQSRVLLQRGCTTAQGYYFSPPLPAPEIAKMLETIEADAASETAVAADRAGEDGDEDVEPDPGPAGVAVDAGTTEPDVDDLDGHGPEGRPTA